MNSFSQAQCLQNRGSVATGYFLPTSFLGSSFQGPFLSAVDVPTGDMPQQTSRLLYVEASVILEKGVKKLFGPISGAAILP